MDEKTLIKATVCLLLKEQKVLLARKTRKIGVGCWNGYGGGVEHDETFEEAGVRELREETRKDPHSQKGIVAKVDDLEKVAEVDFHNTKADGSVFVCRVYFYIVRKWEGEAEETEEMATPTWFPIDDLPYDEFMAGDKELLPLLFHGKKFKAEVWYGPFQKEMLKPLKIEEVDSF